MPLCTGFTEYVGWYKLVLSSLNRLNEQNLLMFLASYPSSFVCVLHNVIKNVFIQTLARKELIFYVDLYRSPFLLTQVSVSSE